MPQPIIPMPITSETSETMTLAIQIGAVTVWIGLVFLTSKILHRYNQDPELVRKVVHIGTGNVLLIAWWLQVPTWLCITAGVVFSAIALLSHYTSILPMLDDVGRKTYGVFYYALSITILVTFLWEKTPQYAAIGVMVMSWGDGMAALVGKRFGKHTFTYLGNKRSFEGSFAMFFTSLVMVSLILGFADGFSLMHLAIAFPVAAIAALLEAFSPGGTDNISVPLSSATLSYFLQTLV